MGMGIRKTIAGALCLAALGVAAAPAQAQTQACPPLCLPALEVVAAPAPAPACPDEFAQAQSLTEKRFASSVTCLVNRVRASVRARAVRDERRLRRAASRHTSSMVGRTFFSHRNGRDPDDRIAATGYMDGATKWVVGENLAWGAGATESTPYAIVSGWRLSAPHRATMLNPRFTDFGIAVRMAMPSAEVPKSPVTVTTEYGYRKG